MPSRADVVAEARTLLGVPWRHQGRTRQGIDCAGEIIWVAEALGFPYEDERGYQRRAKGCEFLKLFRKHMDSVSLIDMRPGDVLIFRESAYPYHAAILASRDGVPTIINANARRKMVVEEPINQGDWMSRRVACFSFRGID